MAGLVVGARVAVNPSRPCGVCRFCQLGLQNHCLDMRYFGSAMRMPHVQGAFRQQLVINAAQAFPTEDTERNEIWLSTAFAPPDKVLIEVRDNGKLMAEMLAQVRYHSEWWWYFGGLVDKLEGGLVPACKEKRFIVKDGPLFRFLPSIGIHGYLNF